MTFSQKNNFGILCFLLLMAFSQPVVAQFEGISIKETSSELDLVRLEDSTATYVKMLLCGDIIHKQDLFKAYASIEEQITYRSWYRQIKPLLFSSDLVIGSLRAFFPGKEYQNQFPNSAPDLFLGELMYSGFDILMMSNRDALTDRLELNNKTIDKINAMDMYPVGHYKDSIEKAELSPLVLEKNDIRIAFLNYSKDSVLLALPEENLSFFNIDSVKSDIKKAKGTMMSDYVIIYIDWAENDTNKLLYVAELMNEGADIIVGTGNGEAFTSADLLSFSDNSLKLHIDNIGYLNALSNERDENKSALIEIILKRDKVSKKVELYDIGFVPTWTLIDNYRYATLPIPNIEEKFIKNVGLNYVQYSEMKIALTDLRYHFFNKIPEFHYDYNDATVTGVEQTTYIRKTLLKNQEKINKVVKENADNAYASLFGGPPPAIEKEQIPYEDIWDIYKKKRIVSATMIESRNTTEMYGELDDIDDNGIVNIKANHKHYQRVKIPPLSAEEKRIRDSIKAYNDRFIVVDTIAEMRKMLKQRRKDSLRIRDSIFKASLDPNYETQFVEVLETSKPYNAYNQQIKSGVFTQVDRAKASDIAKPINEYFMVQFLETPKSERIDLLSQPYLKGYEVRFEDSYYRYLVGRTNSPKLAIQIARSLVANGVNGVKVVRYSDGVRTIYKSEF